MAFQLTSFGAGLRKAIWRLCRRGVTATREFLPRETVGLLGHSRTKAKAELHSDIIRRNRGSQRLPRFTLIVRVDVDRTSSRRLVAQFQSWLVHAHLGFVFMVLAVARVKSPSMHTIVRLCVDVRCVACHCV